MSHGLARVDRDGAKGVDHEAQEQTEIIGSQNRPCEGRKTAVQFL